MGTRSTYLKVYCVFVILVTLYIENYGFSSVCDTWMPCIG